MRDPERIPLVLSALERAWREHPDERLCQLIVNATDRDPFYVEDGTLMKSLGIELTGEEEAYVKREPEEKRKAWDEFITLVDDHFGFGK